MKVEQINPYRDDSREKKEQVREMFDSIAPAYDFMNRAMTFGIDRLWRRKAVDGLQKKQPESVLDIATGTGDLAMMLAKRFDKTMVTGVDLSEKMVEIGRRKVEQEGLASRVSLLIGDCLELPFAESSFECVTCAYGVRNFQDLHTGFKEMLRVLRPGGTLMIIELSKPRNRFMKALYSLYSRIIIPAVGRLISHDVRAYSYLPESIAAVPARDAMTALMSKAGFCDTSFRSLTFGTCTIYYAFKPTK